MSAFQHETPTAIQHTRRSTIGRPKSNRGRSRSIPTIVMAIVSVIALWAAPADAAPRIVSTGAGDITIAGTNGSERVWIYIHDDRTEMRIHHSGGRIDQTIPGPRRNLTIKLSGGDDELNVVDERGTFDETIGGNLTINLGQGSNVANVMGRFRVGGRLNVTDGAGDLRATFAYLQVDGSVTLSGGTGKSNVRAVGVDFDGSFTVRPATSGIADLLVRASRIGGNATLTGTNNVDTVAINGSTVIEGRLSADLRGDDDRFHASRVTIGRGANIRMGGGADATSFYDTAIDGRFSFNGQGGDDSLLPTLLMVDGPSILNGGEGHDLIDGESNTFSVRPRLIGFEVQ